VWPYICRLFRLDSWPFQQTQQIADNNAGTKEVEPEVGVFPQAESVGPSQEQKPTGHHFKAAHSNEAPYFVKEEIAFAFNVSRKYVKHDVFGSCTQRNSKKRHEVAGMHTMPKGRDKHSVRHSD